jgi:hypothetical protein
MGSPSSSISEKLKTARTPGLANALAWSAEVPGASSASDSLSLRALNVPCPWPGLLRWRMRARFDLDGRDGRRRQPIVRAAGGGPAGSVDHDVLIHQLKTQQLQQPRLRWARSHGRMLERRSLANLRHGENVPFENAQDLAGVLRNSGRLGLVDHAVAAGRQAQQQFGLH